MRIIPILLFLCLSWPCIAQQTPGNPREVATKQFAHDLAALQASLHKNTTELRLEQGNLSQAQYASFTEDMLEQTVDGARLLVAKWKSNPYVEVEGFDIAIGLAGPELSVAFRLK